MTRTRQDTTSGTKVRQRLLVLALPIIILLGYLLYEQARVWTAPQPRWIVPSNERTREPCLSLWETAQEFDACQAYEEQETEISRRQADLVAGRMIARQYGFFPLGQPDLLLATFPDGLERLAWYDLVLVAMPGPVEGWAIGIYIDASTGEPLMLVNDIYIGDPCFSCVSCYPHPRLSPAQYQCLFLLFIYLVGLSVYGLSLGLWWLSGR